MGISDKFYPARAEPIKAIGAAARRLEPDARLRVDAAEFVKKYYAHAPEDVVSGDPHSLAVAAIEHLAWAARRTPGAAKVRVFNPTAERDGWTSAHTIVETAVDDMPFLVDSLTMALNEMGRGIRTTIHPVLEVKRTRRGTLQDVVGLANADSGQAESFIHFEIARETQVPELRRIQARLQQTLNHVRAAVEDWAAMSERLETAAREVQSNARLDPSEAEEAHAFLSWLSADHFTLLGYREYDLVRGRRADELVARSGSGLGILRESDAPPDRMRLEGAAREEARANRPLVVTKANRKSTVHRPVLLDQISVKLFDGRGRPATEMRFLGLYTSTAYSESPRDIPLLRLKVRRTMEASGFDPHSHRGKKLQHVLENFPRDDLIQASLEDIARIAFGMLALEERHKLKLFCRPDTFGRFFSCIVYVPRNQFNTQARRRIQSVLEERLGGKVQRSQLLLSESALARLEVTVTTAGPARTEPDVAALEAELTEAVRRWEDRLQEALLQRLPEDQALELVRRFADRFSAGYQEAVGAERATRDLLVLAAMLDGALRLDMALDTVETAEGAPRLRFTTFHRGESIPLYRAMPILENMGVQVVREHNYRVRSEPEPVWIQDFELEAPPKAEVDAAAVEKPFRECFARVLDRAVENDGFNSFVLSAGLDWRQAALLRAYCRYILQGSARFSQVYMLEVLGRYPAFCTALIERFYGLFDPDLPPKQRTAKRAAGGEALEAERDRTTSLDDDRILRAFACAVDATLRTNFFQHAGDGGPKPYISLKLDPERIPDLPHPLPKYEIFVYSLRVEGVHLRGDDVSRGGIRWSDRREDFRTEVLGLMKAQRVKNAVIVPDGAKGGFVCKQLPEGDRDAVRAEVVSCYETFIRGLLDVTDNIVEGNVVGPDRVLAQDGPDPYLVVAADKGTATFSDNANALAAEYGFWLGDAFASGGSAGYDHKEMGITARGAWEAVKRHFREMGVDVRNEPFTAAGIGDMSGDVFGNGMLLSKHIRLVAAFDHRHIFIDPDPDPEESYRERSRLFRLARSSWDDYDRSKLSAGGGVYSRSLKSIDLPAAARARLGIEQAKISPPELIRAILLADVDLLWNGGIGTYVKSSRESHGDAGDPTNDALRVDGKQLRCRVVGEGGNLGFTQLGRVEYALAGGRLNTDFIDNSGGVDSSDREVNIKILLRAAIDQKRLARGKRDALLAEMTESVVEQVLADNYGQTQALSVMASHGGERLSEHARLIRVLEARGLLDRSLEDLPNEEEIEDRRKLGRGLTRPELAVILSYAKIELSASLVASDIPDDPYGKAELVAYFPPRLSKRFRSLTGEHRLAGEIVSMLISSSMINRMGPFFVLRAEEETGADAAQVARAYGIVRELFGVRGLWRELELLDYAAPAEAQYEAMFQIRRMVRRAVYWFLQRRRKPLDIEAALAALGPGVAQLRKALPSALVGVAKERFVRETDGYEAQGLPRELAERVAETATMPQCLDILDISKARGFDVAEVGRLHFETGRRLKLDWIRDKIEGLEVDGRWRAMARATLRENLARQQRALVNAVLDGAGDSPPDAALERWLETARPEIGRAERALDEMQTSGLVDFATLSVALKEIGRLVEPGDAGESSNLGGPAAAAG